MVLDTIQFFLEIIHVRLSSYEALLIIAPVIKYLILIAYSKAPLHVLPLRRSASAASQTSFTQRGQDIMHWGTKRALCYDTSQGESGALASKGAFPT